MLTRKKFEETLQTPLSYWAEKNQESVKDLIGSDVSDMLGFDQKNPHHCYDLWFHTLHVVDYLVQRGAPLLLLVAAFFHDIGKLHTAKEKQGRLVFYGHAQKSVEISIPILENLGYTDKEIEEISFYIGHHDDFISYVLPTEKYNKKNPYLIPINKENIYKRFNKVEGDSPDLFKRITPDTLWNNLIFLSEGDASSQAEEVIQNDKKVDSKAHKLKKIAAIKNYI